MRSLFILGLSWTGPHFFFSPAMALDAVNYSSDPAWRKFELEWLGKPVEGLILGDRTFRFLNQEKRNQYTKNLFAVVAEMEKSPPRGFCVLGGRVIEKVNGGGCKVQAAICEAGTIPCDRIFNGSSSSRRCVSDDSGATTKACVDGVRAWTAISNHLANRLSVVQWITLSRGINRFCAENSSSPSCRELSGVVKTVRVPGRAFDMSEPPTFFKEESLSAKWQRALGRWPELISYIIPPEARAQVKPSQIQPVDASQFDCKLEKKGQNGEKSTEEKTAYTYWGPGGAVAVSAYDGATWDKDDAFLKAFGSGAAGRNLKALVNKALAQKKDEADERKLEEDANASAEEQFKKLQEEVKKAEKDKATGYFSKSISAAHFRNHGAASGILADFQAMRALLEANGIDNKKRDLLLSKYYGQPMFIFMMRNIDTEEKKKNPDAPGDVSAEMLNQTERTDGMDHIEERNNILKNLVRVAKAGGVKPEALHSVLGEMDKAIKGDAPWEERIQKLNSAFDNKLRGLLNNDPDAMSWTRDLVRNTGMIIARQKATAQDMVSVFNDGPKEVKVDGEGADAKFNKVGKSVVLDGFGAGKGTALDLLMVDCKKKKDAPAPPAQQQTQGGPAPFQSDYMKDPKKPAGVIK